MNPSATPRMGKAWLAMLLVSVLCIVTVETALLALGTGFITSGFNTEHIDAWTLWLVFLPASCLLDLGLVLGIWALFAPIARRLAVSPIQTYCAMGLIGIAIPTGTAAALFGVYSVVGDMFSLALAKQFSGLATSAMVQEADFQVPVSDLTYSRTF